MSDPKHEPRELSEGASRLLDAWAQSRPPAAPVSPPDVSVLVRYQSGALGAEEARSVETALIGLPSSRARLKAARDTIRQLRAVPWAEAARQAGDDTFAGEVARAWIELASTSVESAVSARESWQTKGWAAIREQAAAGAAAAKSAWANFVSFGDQMRYVIQATPLAVARSGSDDSPHIEGDFPPGLSANLFAEIDSEGTLTAELRIRDTLDKPFYGLDEITARLALWVNEQAWPLSAVYVEGGRAVWNLPGIGGALRLASGPLPAAYFGVALGDAAWSRQGDSVRLMAEVLNEEGVAADRVPVPIEILKGPRWEAGAFHAAIQIAGPVRRAYATYRLRLDVTVAGTARQCLGYWPLSDWGDAPREISAECPGSPDVEVPHAAVLHAGLTP